MPIPKPGARRLLSFLLTGRPVTVRQASSRYRITTDSVRARISEFRAEGYAIYTNTRRTGLKAYRLGVPSNRVAAVGTSALYR